MELVVIITALALVQFVFFGIRVGQMRMKHGVIAPDTIGDPEFMRMFRVHQNTMEQLVVFLPLLWMFTQYWNPAWGASLGLIFVASRQIYFLGYVKEPKARGKGFGLGFTVLILLLVGTVVGAVMAML
jgi:glutathione S-transferase